MVNDVFGCFVLCQNARRHEQRQSMQWAASINTIDIDQEIYVEVVKGWLWPRGVGEERKLEEQARPALRTAESQAVEWAWASKHGEWAIRMVRRVEMPG